MSFVLEPLFSIFVLLIGGYFAKRIGILKQKQARMFLDFAIIFALPCLIFERSYHLRFDFSLIMFIFTGFICSITAAIIAVLVARIMRFSKPTLASVFLLSSFGNTLFVGIPIVSGIYSDPQYIGEVIFYDAFATALPISIIGPFVISLASNQPINFTQIIKRIAFFPPFIALVLGFALKSIAIPDFIFAPIKMFGGAATAVALFAIGLGLGFSAIKSAYKSTIIVIIAKMIVAPLIFIALIKILHIDLRQTIIVAILESAMPTMTLAGAMVMKAKLDSNLAVSAVAFGILFSFVSIPCLVHFLL